MDYKKIALLQEEIWTEEELANQDLLLEYSIYNLSTPTIENKKGIPIYDHSRPCENYLITTTYCKIDYVYRPNPNGDFVK